jgi:glycosyltransferase involved in cell wall biosynthesis
LEVLVVYDGSTDNTEEVVRGVRDPRMRYLRHESNRGVAAACNTGIDAAKGEVIAFADSDDLRKPNYLRRQVEFLQARPGIGAVFTNTDWLEMGSRLLQHCWTVKNFSRTCFHLRLDQKKYLRDGKCSCVCSKNFRSKHQL